VKEFIAESPVPILEKPVRFEVLQQAIFEMTQR
jgi:hypothetical protein